MGISGSLFAVRRECLGKELTVKSLFISAIAATAIGLASIPGYAADPHESHHAVAVAQKSYQAKGEVVSIDQAAGKIKLKHDAIPDLGWSAMTMNFSVAQKGLLEAVSVGDKVSFEIAKDQATGQYAIQKMQSIK